MTEVVEHAHMHAYMSPNKLEFSWQFWLSEHEEIAQKPKALLMYSRTDHSIVGTLEKQ